MHWHILGAGAIGLRFADKLHRAGSAVTLIVRPSADQRPQTLQRIQILDEATERSYELPTCVANDPESIDALLVATKAFDAESAVDSVAHRLSPDTPVILLLNGYGVQQRLAKRYPDLPIWAASTTDGATRIKPFVTRLAGLGRTEIGPLTRTGKTLPAPWNKLEDVYGTDDINAVLWQKLAINCCINPLTVLFNCKNGALLSHPEAQPLMAKIADEITVVSLRAEVPLFSAPLVEVAQQIAQRTAENLSSMLQDVRAGRPTELQQILGALINVARQNNTETPVCNALYDEISALTEPGST